MQYRVVSKEEHDALLLERVLERNKERQERIKAEQDWLTRRKVSRDLQPDEDCYPYG